MGEGEGVKISSVHNIGGFWQTDLGSQGARPEGQGWRPERPRAGVGFLGRGIGVLQMNTVGVLQLLNFRRNIFV